MLWEERYWLLLDVEWEAGRQKQGSPGYCCSVGGYQQPGSPHDTVAGLRGRWTGLPLSLSLSLQLTLHAPFLCLLSSFFYFFFFSYFFFPTNTIFHFLQSPHLVVPPLGFFMGFPSVSLPRRLHLLNSLWPWMEVSELHSGLRKDLFSTASVFLPTRTPASPFFPSCRLSFSYIEHAVTTTVHVYLIIISLSLSPILICLSLCFLSFGLHFVRQCLMPLFTEFSVAIFIVGCVCVCGQLFLVLHNWCQIG